MVSSTKVPSFIQCNNMSTDKDTDKDKKKLYSVHVVEQNHSKTRIGNYMLGEYMDKDFNRTAVGRKEC